MEDWDSLLQTASQLIESKENYQKRLGQLSQRVIEMHGQKALAGFASQIEDMTGRRVSPTSLRNYAWVWLKTKELELPDDVSFSVCQMIAGTENPQSYADMVKNGMSGPAVARLIRGEKPGKIITCPECGAQFNAKEKIKKG